MTSPHISVIVPVYNGGENFHQCLSSLLRTSPASDEILVVSDASTDGSDDYAESLGLKVLRLSKRSGPAYARNQGAQAAQGELLFFVDADVMVYPDTIGKVLAAFKGEPDLAALIGSYDDTPAAPYFLAQYKNLLHHYVHQTGLEEASTFWGACGAIRRDIFMATGGFDATQYPEPSIEDIELGYRLRAAGFRIRLYKDIQVKHLKRWTVYSLIHTDFFRRALPWSALIVRARQFNNDLNLQQSSRLSVVLSYLMPISAALALLWKPFVTVTLFAVLAFLWLNAPIYQFFRKKRGIGFMVRAIGWHWLYYLYSGLAFALTLLQLFIRKPAPPVRLASLPDQ